MDAPLSRRTLIGRAAGGAAGFAIGPAAGHRVAAAQATPATPSGIGNEPEEGGMTATPFEVNVPQATLDDLRDRLARTRWPDEVNGAGWNYGTNLAYLRELIDYWRDGFDWRAQEAAINRFAHFRAEVDGIGIHYIHERGTGPDPIPLVLLHGWPSSFVQMLDLIPMLTGPAAHGGEATDSFDVVVPSLVGYGFSDRPREPGMSPARMANLFHRLVTEQIGYARYATRSSDLGAGVASQLALSHPEATIGVHMSGTNPYIGQVPENLSPAEQEFVANAQAWMQTEMAYAMEHTSKPQTLAYGLNDSPAGLAAWIVEKFWRWSDHGGNLETAFSKDQLLTNLTVYWATETINSSIRLYYEAARDPGQYGRAEVPTAYLMTSKDMFPTPREWVERTSRVDRWTEIDRGGHFLEWEEPELVAADLREFFRPLRAASTG
jgi:pimeloyl-ACP methyl ester carboxylesterase